MSKQTKDNPLIIFPYYINQARVLDLFAMLNGGYPEYEEITTAVSDSHRKAAKGEVSAGFKLLKIGGSIDGSVEKAGTSGTTSNARLVQTTSSMLGMTIRQLEDGGLIQKVENSGPGAFIEVEVMLRLNSIKSLIGEAKTLLALSERMKSIDAPKKSRPGNAAKQMEAIQQVVHELFAAEEVIYEAPDFAIVGNIVDEHLYQCVRADILGSKMRCLAQVKRVFPDGAQLMRNTVFSKMNDSKSKQGLIESLQSLMDAGNYEFEAHAVTEVKGKPVFEIEIMALYQSPTA